MQLCIAKWTERRAGQGSEQVTTKIPEWCDDTQPVKVIQPEAGMEPNIDRARWKM